MNADQWTYLDVGVSGIQRYLGRTPDLKGRRGASAWISDATDRQRLDAWLTEQRPDLAAAGVEVNLEAGQADGLVPLRCPTKVDPQTLASSVIDDLRGHLPAVRISAHWGTGGTYVEARHDWLDAHEGPQLTSPPPISDFPPLETCGQCRADPAVEETFIHEKRVRVCADCRARYVDRYRQRALREGAVTVGAERLLLNELGLDDQHVAQEFSTLAKLGEPGGNGNHLATVFADGNAIGALFERISAGEDPTAKQHASKAVSDATRVALLAATEVVLRREEQPLRVPVIPHVVGGDDLLVSVVADRAWAFVTAYLGRFEHELRGAAVLAPYLDHGFAPGASAGVVFAHATFPFRRAVELAEELLRSAKRAHAGRTPAVAWLDVTRDGEHPPAHRAAWTVADLRDSADAIVAPSIAVETTLRGGRSWNG